MIFVLIGICAGVWLIGLSSIYFAIQDRQVEEEFEEEWICEHCGFEVYSATLEGVVEGMRIHASAIYCPGDEDDDESYY